MDDKTEKSATFYENNREHADLWIRKVDLYVFQRICLPNFTEPFELQNNTRNDDATRITDDGHDGR